MTNSPVKLWEDPGQIATQIIFCILKGAGVSLNWFELMENGYSPHKAQTISNLVLLDFTGSGVSASISETSALFSSSSAMVLVVLLTTSSWLSLPSITSASISSQAVLLVVVSAASLLTCLERMCHKFRYCHL